MDEFYLRAKEIIHKKVDELKERLYDYDVDDEYIEQPQTAESLLISLLTKAMDKSASTRVPNAQTSTIGCQEYSEEQIRDKIKEMKLSKKQLKELKGLP